MKQQSEHHGTQILPELIHKVDFSKRPFELSAGSALVTADSVVIATGSRAKRLNFPGSESVPDGYYGGGISACAICDGGLPYLRDQPVAVIGTPHLWTSGVRYPRRDSNLPASRYLSPTLAHQTKGSIGSWESPLIRRDSFENRNFVTPRLVLNNTLQAVPGPFWVSLNNKPHKPYTLMHVSLISH
jgi:hypothetical protein